MIEATTGYEAMSFMDGSSGCNQICIALKNEELTTFHTPRGIYYYKVMAFGLKNAGATYQRAMQNIFDGLLHKNVGCYVDDLVVKPRKRDDHLKDLRMVFELLGRYQLFFNSDIHVSQHLQISNPNHIYGRIQTCPILKCLYTTTKR